MDPLTLGIIALVVGAATGTLNAIGNNSDINKQINNLETQKKLEYDQYTNDIYHNWANTVADKLILEKNYNQATEKAQLDYEAQKAETELNFENAKIEANKQADKSDRASTFSESSISNQYNNEINSLILSQAAAGTAYNNQAVQNAQAKGNALSTQAASGTRSSSMNTAIELEAATNAAQLQQAQDQQRQSEATQLNSLITQAAANTFNIGEARRDALNLRGQFNEGGTQYNAYQLSLNNAQNSYELLTSQLKENYDYDVKKRELEGKFNAKNIELAYTAKKTLYQNEIDDLNNNRWLDNTIAFFHGFNSGSSATASWSNLI